MNRAVEDLHRLIEDIESINPNTIPKYRIGEKLFLEVEVTDSVSANVLNYWLYGNDSNLTPMGLNLKKIHTERTDLTKKQLEKLRDTIDDIIYG